MAHYRKILATLLDATTGALPEEYEVGFALPADTGRSPVDPGADHDPEDLTMVGAGSAERLEIWRQRLIRYAARGDVGADEDLAALPVSGRSVAVEVYHRPTGIRAVRAYSYDTIRDLAADTKKTPAQRRNQVRSALADLFQTCQQRVAAVGG